MYDKTWEKVVKVVAPYIRKMEVINASFVFYILLSTYLTSYTSMFLQIRCRWFMTSQSGGPSSHIIDLSLMSMSLKASIFFGGYD